MPTNMRATMSKLLFKYRENWRKIAREVFEKKSRRACFQNLVAFIECQVKIISDPLTIKQVKLLKKQPRLSHLLQKLVGILGRRRRMPSCQSCQVQFIRGNKIIHTHAFVDLGSTATLCSEHLVQRLGITGRKTSFAVLHTVGQELVVSGCALDGIEVAGLGS